MDTCLLLSQALALAVATTHAAALLCATAAHSRAILAMLSLVLCALVSACLAYLGAGLADRTCKLAAACYEASCKTANLSALDVEGNAVGHHFDVIFSQTSSDARIAGGGAGVTGVNAGLKLIRSHGFSLMIERNGHDRTKNTGWRYLGSCSEGDPSESGVSPAFFEN